MDVWLRLTLVILLTAPTSAKTAEVRQKDLKAKYQHIEQQQSKRRQPHTKVEMPLPRKKAESQLMKNNTVGGGDVFW
jgi:hypothetical protein